MNDELSIDERDLADQIRTLAIRGTSSRNSAEVAVRVFERAPVWRRRLSLSLSLRRFRAPAVAIVAVVALAVSVGTVGLLTRQQDASQLATAQVNGLDYVISVARTFEVQPEELIPYADKANLDPVFQFDGLVAYRIRGVDPTQILVMKLSPDQRDDAGPLGDYVLLVRGPDAFGLVCAYFDAFDAATPRACRAD